MLPPLRGVGEQADIRNAFFEVIRGVIRDAVGTGRPVRVCGEMVALLWDAGDVLAAIDLETLWNELAGELPFALYCAYHSESVAAHAHADALHDVCRLHSAVVPAPGEVLDVSADFPAQVSAVSDAHRLVADTVRRWGHQHPLVADARIDVRARPDAAGVIRIHTGGFAERARHKLGIRDPAGLADFDLAGHER